MNREDKSSFVDSFSNSFLANESSFVVKVGGLTVHQTQTLRSKLRASGAILRVGKVRLMKIAADKSSVCKELIDSLGGQVAVVFSDQDSQQVAKSLVDFGKENDSMTLVSGLFKNKFMSQADVGELASIPPYNVLVSRLAGALNSPATNLAVCLKEVVSGLARCLSDVASKK